MNEECPFKSAEELGLTQKEWEALIKTLALMENDAIQHVRYLAGYQPTPENKNKIVFNMSVWRMPTHCGTAMCIGGSAEYFGGLGPDTLAAKSQENKALYDLFYPPFEHLGDYDTATTQQGAKALRYYLTTGKSDSWKVARRRD